MLESSKVAQNARQAAGFRKYVGGSIVNSANLKIIKMKHQIEFNLKLNKNHINNKKTMKHYPHKYLS